MDLEEAKDIPVEWLARTTERYIERHETSPEVFARNAGISAETLHRVLIGAETISTLTKMKVAKILELDGDVYNLGESTRAKQLNHQVEAIIDSDREIPAKKRKEVKEAVLNVLRQARKSSSSK